jgi:hypothetical protein
VPPTVLEECIDEEKKMNNRPFAYPCTPRSWGNPGAKLRYGLLLSCLLMSCLLLSACWGDDETTPEATEQPVAAPVSALPTMEPTTNAPTASNAAALTETSSAATPAAGLAALATTPAAADATITATGVVSPAPTAIPLEADASSGDCEIESNLDLVGYPDLEKRMGCATEPATFDPIAINEFGPADQPTNRFMLWFSNEKNIYVLLPDGTYQIYKDTWDEATDPTYPCNPLGGEEDSPPLPRRGFGKLWCSQPELQSILGTVPREERLCQYSVVQRFETGRLLACFEDATVRYFRILDNGTWDLQVQ